MRQEAVVYYLLAFLFGTLGALGVLRTFELLFYGSVNAMTAFWGFAFVGLALKSLQKARAVKMGKK